MGEMGGGGERWRGEVAGRGGLKILFVCRSVGGLTDWTPFGRLSRICGREVDLSLTYFVW